MTLGRLTASVSGGTIARSSVSSGGFMHPIFAYIDPGSGSLAIQAVIAALVAAPFVLRSQIARVVRRLRGESPTAATTGTTDVDRTE